MFITVLVIFEHQMKIRKAALSTTYNKTSLILVNIYFK